MHSMQTENKAMSGLTKRLVEQGLLDAATLASAAKACADGETVIARLVSSGGLSAGAVAAGAMQAYRLPLLDLDAVALERIQEALVEEGVFLRPNVLPIKRQRRRLCVAVADPADLSALDSVKLAADSQLAPVLVEVDKLKNVIHQVRQSGPVFGFGTGLGPDLESLDEEILAVDPGAEDADEPFGTAVVDEAPIVRFVNQVLLDAINKGASDIHFEPLEESYRIRFRTDGVLSEVAKPPKRLGRRLAARLKVMAALDIAERRLPQDGRIKIKLSRSRTLDLRMNTLPTLWGEKVVLRILDPSDARLGVDALGFDERQKALFLEALRRPEGIVLVTGPTGSGKTVTLYTGLNLLNTPERNIATAEDPVEINLEGINQVNVNTKVGLNFAATLRAFLRQDPDVLMVGEIRDLETAEIAMQASQTGHLVLSTLHTNSAAETLTRLRNIGVPAFNLATSIVLIIAQRLVRRLCQECRLPFEAPAELLLRQGFGRQLVAQGLSLFQAAAEGCSHCRNGYRGRIGVYEIMRITPEITRIIMDDGDALSLAKQAREHGYPSLRASCLVKVAAGVTSLVEANRVAPAEQC